MTMNPQSWAACSMILKHLPEFLLKVRTERGLNMSEAARQIGCCASTIHRIEHGGGCHSKVAERVLWWMAEEKS